MDDIQRDRLIDMGQFMEITGLGRSSLYNRMAAGEIVPVKAGRRTLFSEVEAYAFVQAQLAARQPLHAA